MKRRMISNVARVVVAVCLLVSLIGCGSNGQQNASNIDATYPDAVSILNVAWEGANAEYPAMGGNFESPVENAPGAVPLTDTDLMASTLLIPETLQVNVSDVASVMHMMNANTFTGVALKVKDITAEEAAQEIKNCFMGTQFMCGVPEKIRIITVGNYVVYAYGEAANVDPFLKSVEALDGAALAVDASLPQ